MIKTEEGYKLSTGKVIEPNNGFIGLSEKDGFDLCEGYDGYYFTEKYLILEDENPDLTNEEVKEIAIYMSKLWMKYYNSL